MEMFTYEQDAGKRWLSYVKEAGSEKDSVAYGMLSNNQITQAVPFNGFVCDDREIWKYDITGLLDLERCFAGPLRRTDYIKVFEAISGIYNACSEYMVDPDQVVMDSRYIYIDQASKSFRFVIIPVIGRKPAFSDSVRRLVSGLVPDKSEDCSYYESISRAFNSGDVSASVLEKLLLELKGRNMSGNGVVLPSVGMGVGEEQAFEDSDYSKTPSFSGPGVVIPGRQQKTQVPVPEPKKESGLKGLFGRKNPEAAEAPVDNVPKKQSRVASTAFGGLNIPGVSSGAATPPRKEKPEKSVKPGLFGKKKEKVEKPDKTEKKQGGLFSGLKRSKEDTVPERAVLRPSATSAPVPKPVQPQSFQQPVRPQPFQQPVQPQQTSPRSDGFILRRISTGERFPLNLAANRIGRNREAVDIYITENTHVGRLHAILYIENGSAVIQDNMSSNGTFVNGERINGKMPIQRGDRIKLANEEFELS